MSHQHNQDYLSLYCYLSNEFFNAYSQENKKKKKKKQRHRNTNALESTSPTRLFKCQIKNSNHPNKMAKDHYEKDTDISRKRMISKIMSIDPFDYDVGLKMKKKSIEHHYSSQMADGDKNHEQIPKSTLKKSSQQRSIDDQPNTKRSRSSSKRERSNRLDQSTTVKSFKDLISHLSLSQIEQSTFRLNRTATWRKLHANITPTYYNHIQKFQREHQQKSKYSSLLITRPIMLSPLKKELENNHLDQSTTHSNATSSCILSALLSNDSTHDSEILQSVSEEQQKTEEDDEHSNQISLDRNFNKQDGQSEMVFEENIPIEEFQPIVEVISPSKVPSLLFDDLFSSIFPSKNSYATLENTTNRAEFLIIDQVPTSSFINSRTILDKRYSLSESIEELCLLIRKLLHYEMTEQRVTSLQTIIASQLGILLTYLAIPTNDKISSELSTKKTLEKMTSTDDSQKILLLNIGTQTDLDLIENSIEYDIHQTSLSFESNRENMRNIMPSELLSNSTTLHLPGHRPHHALSDTFVYHIRHHQQYSTSCHRFMSYSATTMHSLMLHRSIKEKSSHLLKYLGEQFQYFVELESSNTCLEASTEFTPDFLLTTMNSSKNDQNDIDDQTEQFGVDTEKDDLQMDTFTTNSYEKDNCDSLELDIELGLRKLNAAFSNSIDFNQSNQQYSNHESHFEDEDILKSSVTEISSLVSITPISESIDDNYLSNRLHFYQLLQPVFNTHQWQTPIRPRQTNSTDLIFEKQAAKMEFKQLRIRSNSNNEINIIGKRVRIKSNSGLTPSTIMTKDYFQNPEQRRKLFTLNYNNNYPEYSNSTDSLDDDISENNNTINRHLKQSQNFQSKMNFPKLGRCVCLEDLSLNRKDEY